MLKYKVGDKVKIKSIDWYNKNKSSFGAIECGSVLFIEDMARYLGMDVEIRQVMETYYMLEDVKYNWSDEMFEEEPKDEVKYISDIYPSDLFEKSYTLTLELVKKGYAPIDALDFTKQIINELKTINKNGI